MFIYLFTISFFKTCVVIVSIIININAVGFNAPFVGIGVYGAPTTHPSPLNPPKIFGFLRNHPARLAKTMIGIFNGQTLDKCTKISIITFFGYHSP